MKIGDDFVITILNEETRYKVYDIRKILPEEINQIGWHENEQQVILVTCTPKYINSHRLLIMGRKE